MSWFADGENLDWSFAHLIAPVVTTSSIILSFKKNRLTQVHLKKKWRDSFPHI